MNCIDEAALEDEADKPKRPPKPRGISEAFLVYDHHGDTLNHATKQSYLCKSYTLHYEVERVLPNNQQALGGTGKK